MGHNHAPNKQADRSSEKLHKQINDRKRNAHVHKERLGKNMRNTIKCFTKIDRAENALHTTKAQHNNQTTIPTIQTQEFYLGYNQKETNGVAMQAKLIQLRVWP